MCMIVCRGLTRYFDDFPAVQALNISVKRGELFGFLGPNGAGKTTTIKMFTGLLRPSAGVCLLGGYDVYQQPIEARRLLGYVPDTPFIYDKLSGREFVEFMSDLYSMPRRGRNEKIEKLLKMLDMLEKADNLAGSYSRGMRQRIALAGALIHEPSALFLDEPTVGLDPRGAQKMQEILRELCRQGTAVFISTHSLGIAELLCNKVAIINNGRLVAEGSPQELHDAAPHTKSLEELFLQMTSEPNNQDRNPNLDRNGDHDGQ